jgi:hypothetical protein
MSDDIARKEFAKYSLRICAELCKTLTTMEAALEEDYGPMPEGATESSLLHCGVLLLFCGMLAQDPEDLLTAASKIADGSIPMREEIRKAMDDLMDALGVRTPGYLPPHFFN